MIIKGFIQKIIYNNTNYHIFALKDGTKVKLQFQPSFNIKTGIFVEIDGDFEDDAKYGRNFIAKTITTCETKASFELLSISIDGLGEKKIEEISKDLNGDYSILKSNPFKIFDYFLSKPSKDILEQIRTKRHLFTSNDKEITAKQMNKEIKGIGKKKILEWMKDFEDEYPYDTGLFLDDEIIIKYLASQTALNVYEQICHIDELENAFKTLNDLKIPNYIIGYLFKEYKFNVLKEIENNPYLLLDYGMEFSVVDNIALTKYKCSLLEPVRIINGVIHIIKQSEHNGNTFINLKDAISNASKLLDVDEAVIDLAITNNTIESNPEFIIKNDKLYRRVIFFTERKLGIMLSEKVKEVKNVIPEYVLKYIENTHLSDLQKYCVSKVLTEKISILTGGPGTGKTTTINEVCNCLDKMNKRYVLCAPTGRAAKRINESTKRSAQTIHRLLEYKPRGIFGSFMKNENYPLFTDYIIVDESSMLDVYMLNNLMKAIKKGTSIIFVGDIDQLPSVSMGSVLRDMKDSGTIPVYTLTEVFRQSLESNIVKNAYHIKNNEELEIGDDFKFIEVKSLEDIEKQLSLISYDYQILCPMRVGDIGTISINQLIQRIKKSSGNNIYSNGNLYYVGDKVIQTDNDYNKEIYNGEIGEIISINNENTTIKYDFNEPNIIVYKNNELYEVDLAYAISIHKSQGSETDNVVIIVDGNKDFISKELIYTAITRAKKNIILMSTYDLDFYSKLKTSNTRMTNLSNLIN